MPTNRRRLANLRTPARMGYYNNYLIDNYSCIVVGVQATWCSSE